MISAEDVAFYETFGYVVKRGVFTAADARDPHCLNM